MTKGELERMFRNEMPVPVDAGVKDWTSKALAWEHVRKDAPPEIAFLMDEVLDHIRKFVDERALEFEEKIREEHEKGDWHVRPGGKVA